MATTAAVDSTAIKATLTEYGAAFEALDADRAAACFAEDAEMTTSDGTYVGRAALAEFLRWAFAYVSEARMEERGFGTRLVDNLAVVEYVEVGVTSDGFRYAAPSMTIAEFDQDGKFTRTSGVMDVWEIVRQVSQQQTGLGRFLLRPFVQRIHASLAKGMPQPTRASA